MATLAPDAEHGPRDGPAPTASTNELIELLAG